MGAKGRRWKINKRENEGRGGRAHERERQPRKNGFLGLGGKSFDFVACWMRNKFMREVLETVTSTFLVRHNLPFRGFSLMTCMKKSMAI